MLCILMLTMLHIVLWRHLNLILFLQRPEQDELTNEQEVNLLVWDQTDLGLR